MKWMDFFKATPGLRTEYLRDCYNLLRGKCERIRKKNKSYDISLY